MVWPAVIAGAAGWLGGKSSSGAIELFTKKEYDSTQTTITNANTYSTNVSKVFDIQYNIASEGSTVSTKKEQAVAVSPAIAPTVSVSPTTAQGSPLGGGGGGGIDYLTLAIIGGVAWYFLGGKKK
ncbi:MAG: hypothetical protein IH845_03880 [Nanoarchaeota archaeon]|nr:hypothetical protein [Nanoarchaeota archaeon]